MRQTAVIFRRNRRCPCSPLSKKNHSRDSSISVLLQRTRPHPHLQRPQYHPRFHSCLFSTNTTPNNEFQSPQPSPYGTTELEQSLPQQSPIDERRKQLIACKIYMNVGGDESHVAVLNDLMVRAQTLFATKATPAPQNHGDDERRTATTSILSTTRTDQDNTSEFTRVGALVQMHMDPYCNRSSLHIAGPVLDVVSVTQDLMETAKNAFQKVKRGCKLPPDAKSLKAAHKVVDILEHVSFLPLLPGPESKITDNKNVLYAPLWVPTYTAYAARQVGTFLRAKMNLQVFFYEYAQRNNESFEDIEYRRKKKFSLLNHIPESTLVGAFPDYVEDVHVLLAIQCGKQRIRDLVQLLNNHTDTGLSDVVASAHLYDVFRSDIHCRLLRPHLSGSNMAAIEHVVKRWNEIQKGRNDQTPVEFVVKCFRVGPTYDECLAALQKVCISEKDRQEYDQAVRNGFQNDASYYTNVPQHVHQRK
jgi:Formiminotransferase domain, N-terminal subdomain